MGALSGSHYSNWPLSVHAGDHDQLAQLAESGREIFCFNGLCSCVYWGPRQIDRCRGFWNQELSLEHIPIIEFIPEIALLSCTSACQDPGFVHPVYNISKTKFEPQTYATGNTPRVHVELRWILTMTRHRRWREATMVREAALSELRMEALQDKLIHKISWRR